MHCECLPKDRSQQDETTPPAQGDANGAARPVHPQSLPFPYQSFTRRQRLNHDD